MARYWLVWFITMFTSFAVPETVAIASGHVGNTLSYQVWNMEKVVPGQSVIHWNAVHLLFTSVFIVLVIWLIGHFGWGIWR